MKYRILVLLLIAAVIGGFGWHNSRLLSEAREKQKAVANEAARLQISPVQTDGVSHKSKLRENDPPPVLAKPGPPEDIAYMRESEEHRKNHTRAPEGDRERFEKIIEQLKALDASQIRNHIEEVRGQQDLSESSRQILINMAVGILSDRLPKEGLDLYVELSEKFPQENGYIEMAGKFAAWAAKDSDAALAWLRANLPEHGESINDRLRCGVIQAIAPKDRKLAFSLIGELKLETPADATQVIVGSAKTPEERIAALADLREYLPTIEDADERFKAGNYAIAAIGRSLAKDSFQAASDWANSSGMTESELAAFGSDIGTSIKDGEQGKWMDWFGEKLSPAKYQKPVRQVMMYWTDHDYKAAGTWLANAPSGPVKNYAITIFAYEVSKVEPEAAVQWAVTLPEGTERQNTLHKIYHNWPQKDDAQKSAAAAFEKEYHIVHEH